MTGAEALALLPLVFDLARKAPELAALLKNAMDGKAPSLEERLRIARYAQQQHARTQSNFGPGQQPSPNAPPNAPPTASPQDPAAPTT